MFHLYILYSESLERFYVGHSNDLEARVKRHNRAGNKYTSKGQPWKLVYSEEFSSKELAYARERQIKKWKSSKMILKLIDETGLSIPMQSERL